MADDKAKQDQESLKAVQQQGETAKELLSTYEKLKKTKKSLNDDDKATLDISKQLVQYSKTLETSLQQRLDKSSTSKQLSETLSKLEKEYSENVKNSANTVANLNKQKSDALKKIEQAGNIENELQKRINKTLVEQDELEDRIRQLKGSSNAADKAALAIAREDLRSSKSVLSTLDKRLESVKKQKSEQKSLVEQLDEAKKVHEETLKIQEKEIATLSTTVKLKNAQQAIDTVIEKTGLKQLANLLTIQGIFTFLVEAAFKVSQQTTELGKSLGVSSEKAGEIRDEFAAYSRSTGDAFVNTDRLMKAQAGLTEQLGFAVKFSGQEAETFARLTEITGLSAQEAGKLAENSAAAGMTTKAYVSDLRTAAMYASHANKVHISDKQLLSEVSKLSAGILVKFQGNPKAIAEAVIQSKKLGLSLEQVNKVGESLLNWESSIENELEAELITGKKLNFEKARAAALSGDQATLMQEISAQAGSLAEFQGMNVIAQESLAKAFGMSKDQMAEMLMKQEAINKYGDAANKLNAEQLEYMEKHGMSADEMLEKVENQRSVQEQFNDAMDNLKGIIADLVGGPLGQFVLMIAEILSNTTALSAILGGVLIFNVMKFVKALKAAKAASLGGAIVEIIKGAWSSLGGLPVVGPVLAGAAIAGGIAYLYSQSSKGEKGDDVMSEGGYGNRTLLTPKGSIKLNNQDTVIAGTNLGGGVKKQPESNSNMAAMSALVGAANSLKEASKKPAVAYINGEDAFANRIGRNNALGTSQVQNSYKLA